MASKSAAALLLITFSLCAETKVLKNFTLIDGNGGAPVSNAAMIIDNGRIFRHGRPEALARDPEVKRVYLGESFTLQV